MNERKPTRRGFLAQLAGAAAALFGAAALKSKPRKREKDLREADFYSPHDLAG